MSTLVWHVLAGRPWPDFRAGSCRRTVWQAWAMVNTLALGWAMELQGASSNLEGEVSIHDPSTIVKCKDTWWVFGTGCGISSKSPKDLATWKVGSRMFTSSPSWTTNTVPGNRGYSWAPDILRFKGGIFCTTPYPPGDRKTR